MSIGIAIYRLLSSDSGVTDLVGSNIRYDQRDHGDVQDAIILSLISESRPHDFQGVTTYATGFYRVAIYSSSKERVKAIADAVLAVLDGHKTPVQRGSDESIDVGYIELESRSDVPVLPLEGKAKPTYGEVQDYAYLIGL